MYTLIHTMSGAELLKRQALPLAASLVIAEVCYKFHSFSLECLSFLATWTALDWLLSTALKAAGKGRKRMQTLAWWVGAQRKKSPGAVP